MLGKYWRELGRTWRQPAMALTLVRLGGSIALLPFLLLGYRWISVVLFLVVAVTDALDGPIARALGQVSDLGKLLDPFVDKVLIIGTLACLALSHVALWGVLAIVVIREVFITRLRVRAAKRGYVMAARRSGKLKMVVQTVAVAGCILDFGSVLVWALIVGMIVLTLYTMVEYPYALRNKLKHFPAQENV